MSPAGHAASRAAARRRRHYPTSVCARRSADGTLPPNPGTSFHIEEHQRPEPRRSTAPEASRRSFGEQTMAKDAIVSDEFAKKFASEKETPYTRWVKSEGLDLISSTYVPNLHTVELKPWARRGGRGVFMNHEASRTSNDCYVCEIPPGKTLSPQRQLFEETIMILARPRLDHGVERRRPAHDLRVEGRRAVRHPAQLLAPALQRLGPRSGALRLGDQRADRHQSLRGLGFHLRHQVRLQGPLQRRAGLLLAPRTRPRASCWRRTSCRTRSTCR